MRSVLSTALGACAMLASSLLSGCATLDKSECETVDWQSLGLHDGQKGKPAGFVGRHRKACARFGLPVDAVKWNDGWQKGIRNYCTPEGGLRAGEDGRANPEVCPSDLQPQFAYYNRIGKRLYDARQTRAFAELEVNSLEEERDGKKGRDRHGLRGDLYEARRRLRDAEADLRQAEEDASAAEMTLKGGPF